MFKTILSVVLLITSIAIFFVWTQNFYLDIQSLTEKKDSLDNLLYRSSEIKQERDDLNTSYKSISVKDLSNLDTIIPLKANPIRYILEMENIVLESRMLLKDIGVQVPEETADTSNTKKFVFGSQKVKGEEFYGTIPIKIKIAGAYEDFYSFIGKMEKNLRLTDIDALSFNSNETGVYEFEIGANIYYQK